MKAIEPGVSEWNQRGPGRGWAGLAEAVPGELPAGRPTRVTRALAAGECHSVC